MLGRISKARHAVVVTAVGGATALAGFGVIGAGSHPERFDSWHVVVVPAGSDGVRITETIDQDFGSNERRGHERFVPNDFGAPIEVVAASPDAPDDLSVVNMGAETRIRIGDPDITITGQHRYTLSYTLPQAQLDRGFLALDLIDGDQFERDRFEVVIAGFELDEVNCFAGAAGSSDRCEIVERDGTYRSVIAPLEPFDGVTIDGTIVGVDAAPAAVEPPPVPSRREQGSRLPLTLGIAGLGVAGSLPIYRWARRRGRNEVFAGGAADAAYGTLAAPRPGGTVAPPPPVTLVPDDELGELATIEFAPPKGVEPWEASVLLTERLGDETVQAWLSGLAGREAIELSEEGGTLSIGSGPKRHTLDQGDAALLAALLAGKDPYVTGTYDPKFAAAWSQIAAMQSALIASSGWWRHLPPGSGLGVGSKVSPFGAIVVSGFLIFMFGGAASALLGLLRSWPVALAAGFVFPAVAAYVVYRALLPARSAQGSALALRSESFRRFLHASEGQHVEWAWSKGLLREYSGWAVALGEADAWGRALEQANVPAPARASVGPIIVAGRAPSIAASRTKPSASGSGSGGSRGGFSGGRVGGGGGGGRGGSW